MKKSAYILIFFFALTLAFLSLISHSPASRNNTAKITSPEEVKKNWESSPAGIQMAKWKASTEGKKVLASRNAIQQHLTQFSEIEALVEDVEFTRSLNGKSGPKWLIVSINKEKYMMQFNLREFQKLQNLKVHDKITIKSRNAGFSPNHPYLILSSDYIEYKNTVIFERDINNNGC
jgi:hypothetical protein